MRKHIHRAKKIKDKRDAKENPRIRPFVNLLKYHFYIPRYHRSYRWKKEQITQLLNDIIYYHNVQKQINPFYCLQPIVVKKRTWVDNDNQVVDGREVIDGQQRLTTLLLILSYLETIIPESVKKILGDEYDFYTIDYETRTHCKEYLQNKKYNQGVDSTNIDFYHISNAYQHISQWFDNARLDGVTNAPNSILNTLLGKEQNVSVIWYEQTSTVTGRRAKTNNNDDSSIELFKQLNEEKIPLTNAELIRALILQSDTYPVVEKKFVKQRFDEIASQWDEIEGKLQDEKMWCFINDLSYQPTCRIELLFKILADKWNGYEDQTLVEYNPEVGKPENFKFLVFEKHLKEVRKIFNDNLSDQSHVLDPINKVWSEVKDLFATINEWYNNHGLYHYIGFLLTIKRRNKMELLRELTELKLDKDEFLSYIRSKIAKEIKLNKNIDELQYDEDYKAIIQLLLLMDIETLARQEKEFVRFPFYLYKKENSDSSGNIISQELLSVNIIETPLASGQYNSNKRYIPMHSQHVFPKEIIVWNTDDKQNYFSEIKKVYDSYTQLLIQNNDN